MNDLPRQILARIIAERGREICDSPKRVEALLRDLSPTQRREINIIVGALEERVAADLIAAGKSVPRDVLLARLAARLRDNLAYTPEAARWGVETWAVALGVLSEDEVKERARLETITDTQHLKPPPITVAKPLATKQAQSSPPPPTSHPHPKRGAQHAPPKPLPQNSTPKVAPPLIARPPSAPRATPRTHVPPVNAVATPTIQTRIPPPVVQPQPAQSKPVPRRGVTLRGCLVTFVVLLVLIIAAVFIIPAVIVVLQEEQAQPSINEPRIK